MTKLEVAGSSLEKFLLTFCKIWQFLAPLRVPCRKMVMQVKKRRFDWFFLSINVMSKIFLDVDWKAKGLWTQGQIQKLRIEFLTQSDNHFHRFSFWR